MREVDRRVALLRLLLADVHARLEEARSGRDALRGQLARIVDVAVRSNVSVPNALAALAEVEERASQHETTIRHLTMLQRRAQSELEALLVTQGVSDAHARLARLEARRGELLAASTETVDSVPESSTEAVTPSPAPSTELAEVEAEIAELRATIEAASDAAARALTEGPRENPPPESLRHGDS